MDFGDKVRRLRESKEFSTTELSKLSGLSQSFISDIENKRRISPTMATVNKLSKAFRVPAAYFLDDDIATPFDIVPDDKMPPELKGFINSMDSMPYLKLSKLAKEKGISPEMLEGFIELMLKSMDYQRR